MHCHHHHVCPSLDGITGPSTGLTRVCLSTSTNASKFFGTGFLSTVLQFNLQLFGQPKLIGNSQKSAELTLLKLRCQYTRLMTPLGVSI